MQTFIRPTMGKCPSYSSEEKVQISKDSKSLYKYKRNIKQTNFTLIGRLHFMLLRCYLFKLIYIPKDFHDDILTTEIVNVPWFHFINLVTRLTSPLTTVPPFKIFRNHPIYRGLCCSHISFNTGFLSPLLLSISFLPLLCLSGWLGTAPKLLGLALTFPLHPSLLGYFVPQVPGLPVVLISPWNGSWEAFAVVEGHFTSCSQVYLVAFTVPFPLSCLNCPSRQETTDFGQLVNVFTGRLGTGALFLAAISIASFAI